MKFIDLFAGLGGFHQALKELGHECVYGCEINDSLRKTYEDNFGLVLDKDIRTIDIDAIPDFDILCAGFPCQSFSKAGNQKGVEDERGALFENIIKILKKRGPDFFILENVPHLARHNDKETWRTMQAKLKEAGYAFVDCREYSPHEFGVPQHRRRIYILGSRNPLPEFGWIDNLKSGAVTDVRTFLDANVNGTKRLDRNQLECIDVWQEFLSLLDADEQIGFPIWSFEFGATYPYQKSTPYSCADLSKYKGSFGLSLKGSDYKTDRLPSYARREDDVFPSWKQHYISQNRKLYSKYQQGLGPIIKKIQKLPLPSWQKFEWNCQFEKRTISDKILQFRASGLRVKKTDFVPSLVCTNTQIPIIGWESRYISQKEALRLQSFPEDFILPSLGHTAYVALGNAVNVKIVKLIAENLLRTTKVKSKEQSA